MVNLPSQWRKHGPQGLLMVIARAGGPKQSLEEKASLLREVCPERNPSPEGRVMTVRIIKRPWRGPQSYFGFNIAESKIPGFS